ncbi:MAG: nucleotidyltransferase family protein [Geobacteraceae bacterium]|nr:nucleotidyltransferase family protein [Geobacteraceae bacterium]
MERSRTEERLLSFLRFDQDGAGTDGTIDMSATDWEALQRTSAVHGVSPLLYHHLAVLHKETPVPPKVLRELRRSYLKNAGRNLYLYHELGKVLGSLQQERIPVIALKGAHLAKEIYGNSALRPMNDVDLLVHREDLGRVEKSLMELGFLPADCNRMVADDNCHFGYSRPNGGLTVEIHWTLLPATFPFRIDMAGQWQRSRTTIIGSVKVSVLCPEDLLLYLCLHASKHLYQIWLKPFYDISETIRHYAEDIDWDQIRIRSEQTGVSKSVYLTLGLARELLGAAIPKGFLDAVKPADFDERYIALAKGQIFESAPRTVENMMLPPSAFRFIGSHSLLNKANVFTRRIFPSREEMSRKYPAPADSFRIYLYYPARILDLLRRHGRTGWLLLRRNQGVIGLVKQEKEIAHLRDWLMSAGSIPGDRAAPE